VKQGASPDSRPEERSPDSPRERLLAHGPESLSNRDLLAVVLPSGTNGDVVTAQRLLRRFGSLRGLASASPREFQVQEGMGRASAVRLAAAFALGRRLQGERMPRGRILRESGEIFAFFHERLRDLKKERFITVLLDGKNRVIREDLVSEGILTASLVHPREVFAPAIRERAGGLVLVHNHPSGDPEPSAEDLEVTRRLCAVGELVGIRVLDHVVVGDGSYVSFLERGLIEP
jgi:DNA repair protein RadC